MGNFLPSPAITSSLYKALYSWTSSIPMKYGIGIWKERSAKSRRLAG
jgi:hypothetical protein